MQQYRKNLGKVSLTAEGVWDIKSKYDVLSIVYDEHTQHGFISKQPVPIGVDLYNSEYWMPLNVSGYTDSNIIILNKKTSDASIETYTLEEAVKSIASVGRKPGCILGFYNSNANRLDIGGRWEIWQFNSTTISEWEDLSNWQNIYYNYNQFVGWYRNEEQLKINNPYPEVGCYAYVGNILNEAVVYRCEIKHKWIETVQRAWDYVKIMIDGTVTVGRNGNWYNNGEDTGIPANVKGDPGLSPYIRYNTSSNKLEYSYDKVKWIECSDYISTWFRLNNNKLEMSRDNANWNPVSDYIAAWFRWQATAGDTQANNVGRIQMSKDNGKTWTNMSNDFINNLHISRYIGVSESLPTSGIAEGTIYAKGPYYAEGDISNDNPIYKLWVYAWKDNTLAWQDNGEFTSIAAGVVQETGNSENAVMSQKAVTEKLSELGSELGIIRWYNGSINEDGSFKPTYVSRIYSSVIKAPVLVTLKGNYVSPFYALYDDKGVFVERVLNMTSNIDIKEGYIRLCIEKNDGTQITIDDDFYHSISHKGVISDVEVLFNHVGDLENDVKDIISKIGHTEWTVGSIDEDGSLRPTYNSRAYTHILKAPIHARCTANYNFPFYLKYNEKNEFVERVLLDDNIAVINEGYIRLCIETNDASPININDDFIIFMSYDSIVKSIDDIKHDIDNKILPIYKSSYVNLFNSLDSNYKIGSFVNWVTGALTDNDNYDSSGYIKVDGDTDYVISPLGHYAWYDEGKYIISGGECTTVGPKVLHSPSNAKYLRVSIDKRIVYSHDLYVYEGNNTNVPYKPFGIYSVGLDVINDIAMPSKEYMLKGFQSDWFVEPVVKRYNPYTYDVRVLGNINYLKRLKRVASFSSSANGYLTTQLVNRNNFVVEKSIKSDIVVGDTTKNNSQIKVSIIGDSFTQGSEFDGFFKAALLDNGYVPNIKLVGTRRVKDYTNQHMEGRGGWKMSTYFTYIPDSIYFFNPFMQPDGQPKFWGTIEFWKKAWEVKKGVDTSWNSVYRCGAYDDLLDKFDEYTGMLKNPSEGDIMYDYTNSKLKVYSNGQWFDKSFNDYTWNFNYSKYLSMWGIETPDILCEMLGLNDFYMSIGKDCENIDFTSFFNNLDSMITSYFQANPNGKFAVLLHCSSCGSMDNIDGEYTDMTDAAMWNLRKRLIEKYDNRESEGIYIVDIGIAVDKINGFTLQPTSSSITKPFPEYNGDIRLDIQTNVPHPTLNYPSMGRPLAAFIQSVR